MHRHCLQSPDWKWKLRDREIFASVVTVSKVMRLQVTGDQVTGAGAGGGEQESRGRGWRGGVIETVTSPRPAQSTKQHPVSGSPHNKYHYNKTKQHHLSSLLTAAGLNAALFAECK